MEHKICRCLEGRPKLPKNYYVFIKFSCKALGVQRSFATIPPQEKFIDWTESHRLWLAIFLELN